MVLQSASVCLDSCETAMPRSHQSVHYSTDTKQVNASLKQGIWYSTYTNSTKVVLLYTKWLTENVNLSMLLRVSPSDPFDPFNRTIL